MSVNIVRYGDPVEGIEKGSGNGLLTLAINVTNQAKSLCPTDTGNLRSSIGYSTAGNNTASPSIAQSTTSTIAYVGTAVEYGTYQEFGTRYMAAQPFLRPAIDIEARGKKAEDVLKFYQKKNVTEAIKRGKKVVKF